MAKIPLRAYVQEIENLIERGEIEQAIAHAKNILHSYPKHIQTYRLLGKAYLESQRYSEAADILQRVLSVIPDDFVSQIGMSIIREDEGNLDAAIWHMERAYEVQPFNPAIQDELRRLYGRRDGVEPPRIRLTRGALVRMYTRGELYPQAIAETRAALVEDPQRLDLRVLLARLYYVSGMKNDAAEVCSDLLSKLPFCQEANRLLAEILPNTNRADEAVKFQQRIYALDPYVAFISPSAPTSEQVPDQAVMIEHTAWDATGENERTPEWAQNIGVTWEETKEENLPDWLNTLKPGATTAAQSSAEAIQEEPRAETPETPPESATPTSNISEQEEVVPDWMKDAGWTKSDGETEETLASANIADASLQEEAAEILPAEIPDWLQSIAPEEATGDAEPERDDWLAAILPPGTSKNGSALEQPLSFEPEEGEALSDLPDWITDLDSEKSPDALSEESSLPDWYIQEQEETAPVQSIETGEAENHVETPEEVTPSEVPDWFKGFENDLSESAPENDLISGIGAANGELEQPEAAASAEEVPEWLKSLEAEVDGPSANLEEFDSAGENTLELPDAAAAEMDTAKDQSAAEVGAEDGSLPDFAEMDDAMAWLEALAAKQGADEATLITPPDQRSETPPDWVQKETESKHTEEQLTAENRAPAVAETEEISPSEASAEEITQPVAVDGLVTPEAELETTGTEESMPEMPDLSDENAVMAWLETLAARQGADEATLITRPEERTDVPPDWVKKEMETAKAEEQREQVESLTAGEVEMSEEAIIEEMGDPAAAEVHLAEITPPDEIEVYNPQATDEGVSPSLTEETNVEMPSGEPETPSMPDFADMDDAMAWLESLAAKQGADEATLTTSPEQRTDVPPEWVRKEMETEAADKAAETQFEPVQPEETEEAVAAVSNLEEGSATSSAETSTEVQAEPPAATAPTAEEKVNADETPVWPSSTKAEAAQSEPAEAGEAVPDWLKTLEIEEQTDAAGENEPFAGVEGAAFLGIADAEEQPAPEWLQSIGEDEAETPPPGDQEQNPNWMLGADAGEESEFATTVDEFPNAWEPEIPAEAASVGRGEKRSEPAVRGGDWETLQSALKQGHLEAALDGYNRFIQNEEHIEEIIHDLRDALYRYPVDIAIWQSLGDAFARNNQFQDALDAYTKAEELLR